MNIAAKKRLKFIESRLYWEGWIRRGNIEDFFQISTPQATKDIKEYKNSAPDNISYDPVAKMYVRGKNFEPTFEEPCSEDYLTRLLHLKRRTSQNEFFCGTITNHVTIPRIRRFVDTKILRNLTKALNDKMAIKISYQSMTKDSPTSRWITPHSLAHDGNRWHVRAFCHEKHFFSDFNLSRILQIIEFKEESIEESLDYQWNTEISLEIEPNHSLSGGKRACIELDYDMDEDGKKEFKIPAAFYHYAKIIYGFDVNKDDKGGLKQQIILKNKTEVEQKFDLLHEMSISAINNEITQGKISLLK
jgi:WYL domain